MAIWRDQGMGVQELDAITSAAVMSNGLTIFNSTGDVLIVNLQSECITSNNATATTIQYAITGTGLTQVTISGVSASIANYPAGNVISLDGTSLATAPNLYAFGVGLGQTARGIIYPAGIISLIVGVGSTTGTWKHYIRYRPIEPGAIVTPAF